MRKTAIINACMLLCSVAAAQGKWTVGDCISYALGHSHEIAQRRLSLANSRADRLSAAGAFLPSVDAGIGAQCNFGRAINPETNTYTDVSTFYNSYSAQLSLPVFDGMYRVHQLQAARAGVLLGKTQLQIACDEVALRVFQAYVEALYCQGTVGMAEAKLEQSRQLLRQTQAMVETGLKSEADKAQIEAQVATDEYELTRQQNTLAAAMLSLKEAMGAIGTLDSLDILDTLDSLDNPEVLEISNTAALQIESARLGVTIAEHRLAMARSGFFPSVSINAGISTAFFKATGSESAACRQQLRNNAGEYIGMSVSIPVFSRLSAVAACRRQRNNLAIAREELAAKRDELTRLRLQAEADCTGLAKETEQMHKKVEAASLALQIVTRQFEEGLSSPIDVQTAAATLLHSRASLLRCRLTLVLKRKLREYYGQEDRA